MSDITERRSKKIRCDACPVMCYIADNQVGACDRYFNDNGKITRVDPLTFLDQTIKSGGELVPFDRTDWDGNILNRGEAFVTGIGAGTTYPDYKPAPFIVSRDVNGADFITVVTEAIFSYCGAKIKIDTDRHIGHETATVRSRGQAVGHVTTAEYGSQMLSLGGVNHLTGGSKAEGVSTCDALMSLCNKKAVELTIDGGATIVVQSGKSPIVNGKEERRMRVGCGSAAIGMFASQWRGRVDEVVIVDDHITGVVSEHQAGKVLNWPDTGIRIKGKKSTPGRYFQVAEPGMGWGGTDIEDPRDILDDWNPKKGARPGLTILMVSTTGEQSAYYVLNEDLIAEPAPLPPDLRTSVKLISDNCEPAHCTVFFMGGAGGSLRAGVTQNPIKLTHSVQAFRTRVTVGGVPAYVWPGGGITIMVDIFNTPDNSFGYVPTPAIVAPLEFTLPRDHYSKLGGHTSVIRSVANILQHGGKYGDRKRTIAPPPGAWSPLSNDV